MTPERVPIQPERFALLDHAPIGQMVLRQDMTVLFWNRCLEAWTGIDRSEMIGRCILEHFPHLGAPKYARRIEEIFQGGPPSVFSTQLHRHLIPASLPGGKLRRQHTVVTPLPAEGEQGYHALFAIQDVTSLTEAIDNHHLALKQAMAETEERKRAEAELMVQAEELKRLNRALREQTIRDGLTELFNHRHFYYVLRRDFLLAERAGVDLGLILLDLDHFKEVNDAYGHPCGDMVLKGVADLIRSVVRKTDVVARYGGEEFAVLLPNTELEGALVTAQSIRRCIERHRFVHDGEAIRLTASFGVSARCAHDPARPQDLLAFADKALYKAKRLGRNRVDSFDSQGEDPLQGNGRTPLAGC